MKSDKLMDALKAFEIKGQDEIKGGYYKIVYGQGRNPNESHATIYDSADHVYSQGYYDNGWENRHPSGIAVSNIE